ncbi:MAG: galactokinase [Spirochaetales bacterium]|nr:galactokinase [Spirochaetales bacterium]
MHKSEGLKALMLDVIKLHEEEYGSSPVAIGVAPGTINLLGEHTDYNEGYVLQFAIPKYVWVSISTRADGSFRFYAANTNERKKSPKGPFKYRREDRWANYSKGVISGFSGRGLEVPGLDVTIYSEIPQDIGLGSSDALCVAATLAIQKLLNVSLTDADIISIANGAEKDYMGLPIEVTDVMTSLKSRDGKAIYIDLRSMEYSYIPLRLEDAILVGTNSHVPPVEVGEYVQELIDDCYTGVGYLNTRHPGRTLRDFSEADVKASLEIMPEAARRLCLHVIEENSRVVEGKKLLEKKNYPLFGKLMSQSHESLRDNYEVSCPEIDWLVKRAIETDGVYGSRITGPGFGGCTVTLMKKNALLEYTEKMLEYERIFGFSAEVFQLTPVGGAFEYFTHQ